jgi:hypothetical protein
MRRRGGVTPGTGSAVCLILLSGVVSPGSLFGLFSVIKHAYSRASLLSSSRLQPGTGLTEFDHITLPSFRLAALLK